ncbi:ABC transporter permease [Nonomuraea sp. NPDC026600]|uniref:ABC transporter permease n=1 Tax=Nonomuraea sp. NPDC026600 TaxID=3155363 RepID=UPI00340AC79C
MAHVESVGHIGQVKDVNVYRHPDIPSVDTNGLSVNAASLDMPATLGVTLARGRFLNAATESQPVVVLGAAAARYLGIDRIWPTERIWLNQTGSGGQWFYVAGVLNSAVLTPSIDASVFVGYPVAQQYFGFDGHPSTVYLRAETIQVTSVWSKLAGTANPQAPNEVSVSQPSAALVAQAAAESAFNVLFLGLGAVALLVGAVGVANIMVISVLERRSEIGLRRALGATKGSIRAQFLSESVFLSLIGGVVGIGAGVIATAVYATTQDWAVVIPALAWSGGLGVTVLIGAAAGLLPALRAARMDPSKALLVV